LLTHSGRQSGGEPKKSGRQEHEGLSPDTTHTALGPHGDGTQGFGGDDWIGVSATQNKSPIITHSIIENSKEAENKKKKKNKFNSRHDTDQIYVTYAEAHI
jgi:hypothetical protein